MYSNELVELLLQRFRIEEEKNDRGGIYAYTQRKLAYNSNKIEGSTLTERQTASIFETGTITADGTIFRTKDIEEMTGHFTMFNYMLKSCEEKLSEEIIKSLHYYLKAGVFEDMANGYPIGEYKNRRNIVSDIETSLPECVEEDMQNLLNVYHMKEVHTLEDIVMFHAAFEKIHPFQDGNGRVGRMLVFRECLKNHIVPLIIEDARKAEYYECLHKAQIEENHEMLCAFFKEEQKEYEKIVEGFVVPVVKTAEKAKEQKPVRKMKL